MNCPICKKELKVVMESDRDKNAIEAIGTCESCDYDGIWLIERSPAGELLKEYGLKKYFHG